MIALVITKRPGDPGHIMCRNGKRHLQEREAVPTLAASPP